jgi:thiol-disulfide isomerase/thioredoxin
MIKKYYTILLISFSLIISSCADNKKQISKEKDTIAQDKNVTNIKQTKIQPTFLIGRSNDSKAFRYFNLLDNSYLFGKNHEYIEKEVFQDSMVLKLDSLQEPQLMEVIAFGDNQNYYRTKFFVKPGDTIFFEMEYGKINSIGRKNLENNFYQSLYDSTPDYATNNYGGDIQIYGNITKDIYHKKLDLLKQYLARNNNISDQAISLIRQDLKFEYLNNLIQPRNIPSNERNFYFNEQDGLLPIVQRESGNSEKIFSYKDYFGDISVEDFKKASDLTNTSYKNSINPYIRYYFLAGETLPYTKDKFLEEKGFIEKHLDGEVRNYAIARMISDYHNKGFGYSKKNVEILQNVISEYETKFDKDSYQDRMDEIKNELRTFDFKLPEKVLNTKLISNTGAQILLKDILKSDSELKILDLWASWCPPCIRDIRETTQFKKKLKGQFNVEWIYLSVDTNPDNWKKGSSDLKPNLNLKNSFLVEQNFKSELIDFFNIKGIPRYIIIDRDNNIVIENAPSPFYEDNFYRVINNIAKN